MNNTSFSLLTLAGRHRDAEAWRRLEQIYVPLLHDWLKRSGVESADADDLAQDVMLTVLRELPQFEHSGRPGAFRSWLRTTLVHRLRNFWRSRRYLPAVVGGTSWAEHCEQLSDDASDASREWNRIHDEQVMARLLEQIRPRFAEQTWEAFWRQVFEGQRADTVASALGISLSSAYVARSRVLKALRQEASELVDGE